MDAIAHPYHSNAAAETREVQSWNCRRSAVVTRKVVSASLSHNPRLCGAQVRSTTRAFDVSDFYSSWKTYDRFQAQSRFPEAQSHADRLVTSMHNINIDLALSLLEIEPTSPTDLPLGGAFDSIQGSALSASLYGLSAPCHLVCAHPSRVYTGRRSRDAHCGHGTATKM